MRKVFFAGATVMVLATAVGLAGCSSSPSAAATAAARKTAFCGANIRIDKATVNANSVAAFVAVLKVHKSDLTTMGKNLPAGTLGTEAKQQVAAGKAAIVSGNANDLQNIPPSASGDIDTYCGVTGKGGPLPAYFATGKGSTFCQDFVPIYEAVGNASNAAGVLAALDSNKAQIAKVATEVPALPNSIKAKASAVVTTAQTALAENSAAPLNGSGNGPAPLVALYCGQNQ